MSIALTTRDKSRIIFIVLLFLFHNRANAICPRTVDTLIVDGEYIYIERIEQETDVDSIEKSYASDVKREKIKKELFNLDLLAGFNANIATYNTSVGSKQPLDHFMGNRYSVRGTLSGSIDGAFHLKSWKATQGEKRISLRIGVGYNQITFVSTQFKDPTQLDQDSILRFYTKGDRLIMEYFYYTSFPFGEVDTIDVSLTKNLTRISVLDLPVRLRYTQSISEKWSWLGEAGILNRRILKKQEVHTNYILNEKAEYTILPAKDFDINNQLLATLSIGARWYPNGQYEASQKRKERMAFTYLLTATGPPYQVNRSDFFYFNFWSLSLQVGVGVFF